VRRDGHVGPVRRLSGGGESAYAPAFLPSADGQTYLGWPRRTFGQFVPFANGSFQPFSSSPFAGVGNQPVAAVDATGTIVLAWSAAGVMTAQARPGEAFSTPSDAVAADHPQMAVTPGGTVIAAFTDFGLIGAAARPPGGEFGSPVGVVGDPTIAWRIIGGPGGEVLVAYVDESRHLWLQRLTPALSRVGPRIALGVGDETSGVALARDGSAVFAAWTVRSTGAVRVRRIAPSGLGPVRTLAPRSLLRGHPPTTAAGAVAWVNGGGTLLMSRYR
jgi:hypothetical protein